MPAIAKGTTYQRAGKFFARVTIGGPGKRPEFHLPTVTTLEAARERTAVLAGLAALLRTKASAEQVKSVLERAATANGRGVQAVRDAADAIASGRVKLPDGGAVTVARLAEQLRSGEFVRRFPKYTIVDDHEVLARHVLPVIGSKFVAEVTLSDCDEVMAALPLSKTRSDGTRGVASTLAHHTRRSVAIAMDRFFALSVDPLRIRAYSPIPAGFIPYKILGIGAARFSVFGHDVTLDELALLSGTSAQSILTRMNSGMTADVAAFPRGGGGQHGD